MDLTPLEKQIMMELDKSRLNFIHTEIDEVHSTADRLQKLHREQYEARMRSRDATVLDSSVAILNPTIVTKQQPSNDSDSKN